MVSPLQQLLTAKAVASPLSHGVVDAEEAGVVMTLQLSSSFGNQTELRNSFVHNR